MAGGGGDGIYECMLRGGIVGGIFTLAALRREGTEMGDGGRD